MKRKIGGYDLTSEPFQYNNQRFVDRRGYFMEVYNQSRAISEHSLSIQFIQDNISRSTKGVIRGLHFQWEHPQDKLITVLNGSIIDIIVDIRKELHTFGQVYRFNLNAYRNNVLFVPRGFAHGFIALEDDTLVMYKVSSSHRIADDEGSIKFNDPTLNIDWLSGTDIKERDIITSERDANAMSWNDFKEMISL